jgi:Zinc knuckle
MMAYLKETYEEATTLSRVGARQDLENCTLKKDENPKVLFERLAAVQFKCHGNAQANITNDDLVPQAAVYNSTVTGLYKTEHQLGNAVTLNVLKREVGNHYAIAMRGNTGPRVKDIEGRFAAMEEQVNTKEKDNLKRMIQETINTTIQEFQIWHHALAVNHAKVEGLGAAAMNGGTANANKGNMGYIVGNSNYMMTPDAVMAIVEAAKGQDVNQINTTTMLCYNCGQFGHWSDRCRQVQKCQKL